MKVVSIHPLDNCLDGDIVREALLDEEISRDLIEHMGSYGALEYHASFARPFFRISVEGRFILKGIERNRTVRLILNRAAVGNVLNHFTDMIEEYSATQTNGGIGGRENDGVVQKG